MILFIKLLIAHIIGDFVLQTTSSIKEKEKNKIKSIWLYYHVLIHGILSVALIMSIEYWKGICFLIFTHLIIDLWKLYNQNDRNRRSVFMIDQIMHIMVILVITDYYIPWISEIFMNINIDQVFLFVLTILLITIVSSHVIKIIISKWQPENEDEEDDSLTNAGSFIGMLERLFVFGFIISGNIQGIGFLLAAKSVFRFGDLKESVDRKLTEYILIGTLLSFGIAVIISFLYLKIKI